MTRLPPSFSRNATRCATAPLLALLLLFTATSARALADPASVKVAGTPDHYHLELDGHPFFIQGAGGDHSRKVLKDLGGNAVRTWGADHIDQQLDECQKLGLKVLVGLWMGHERHGFNYADPAQVAAQEAKHKAVIAKYKDHPAVLAWAIGNEMEGYAAGDNPNIWSAVDRIAEYAKSVDPNHPTMTVIAEIGGKKVPSFNQYCPHVDILGINSYGGLPSLPQRYRAAGGTKPYVVTEFGPPGTWEVGKTEWGAPPEPTSTQKAASYRTAYEKGILAEKDKLCLGSFAFAWGHKQEATATWFGLFLPDGTRLAAVDALHELWTGQPLANRAPAIQPIKVPSAKPKPGATLEAKLTTSDPEHDPLTAEWVLQEETARYGEGGDREVAPPVVKDAVLNSDTTGAKIRLPDHPGKYRLYVTVRDNHGGGATANVPLLTTDRP